MVQQLVGSSSLGLGKLIDGKNQFIHIRYSAHSNGSNMTTEIQADTKYIGIATNSSETAPTSPSDYSWGRFVGTPGVSSYTWIRYSSNADGSNMTTIPNEETKYIGVAVTAEDSAPTDYTRYSWALFKGSDGRGVKKTEVSYQKSTSGTVIPTGSWLASIPSLNEGEYLWTRTLFTYTDGTTTSTYNVSRNGTSGLGIARTDVHYQKSTSGTVAPTGTWTVTIPTVRANEYLWTRTTITYTDDSTSVSYSVGKMGADGKDAQLLYLTASSQIQAFDKDNQPKTTQPITISAKLQNASGTATFTAIPYIGNTAQTPITLGGTGNDRTLLPSQWTDPKWTIIAITATLGSLTDTISVNKVKDGESGETPVVHIAWADSADGSEGFTLELPTNKIPKYRGYYVDYSTVASTDPKKYKWERNPDDTGAEVDKAMTAVESAIANAEEAERLAATASQTATIAKQEASAAQNAASMAQGEVSRIEGVIVGVQGDIDTALQEVADQAADLQATKETLELNYAKKTEVSDVQAALTTEISKKVGELQTTVSQTYAAKNDVVSMEGRLQSQITQTAGEVSSVVGKVDKLEADTTEAQKKVDEALEKSAAAQATASQAQAYADAADRKVTAAQTDLNEAKQNLVNTINRVDATEADIAEAQLKVESAQAAVAQAQKDAAEAALAASNAQAAADKAQQDVAALTKRVVSAETAITQNSEQIQLAATRTEEIGDELKNNYYTKEQADAAITVKADSITQTVSSTYATKGNTIKSTVEEFYQSTSPTSLSGGSWSTTQPTWAQGKYIWRRTKNTYGNDTVAYTPSVNGVCITGNTGASGQNGKGVSSYSITYQVGTSGTTAPTGTWTTTIPSVPQGQYLWTKMVITYTDNTSSTSYSVSYIPVNGQAGATGNGVKSITTEFYLSTSKTTQTGGSWSTTQPTWSPGKYVWTRNKITYTNGSTAYTTPQCSSEWEAVNEIQVGGRNLLFKTGYFDNSKLSGVVGDSSKINLEKTIVTDENSPSGKAYRIHKYKKGTENVNGGCYWVAQKQLTPGKKYTWSAYVRGVGTVNTFGPEQGGAKAVALTGTWTKVSHTFTANSNKYYQFTFYGDSEFDLYLTDLMLEEGNTPSPWSPAPEDMATAGEMDKLTQTVNTKIEQTSGRIDLVASSVTEVGNKLDGMSIGGENLINLSEIKPREGSTIDTSNYIKRGEVILTIPTTDYAGMYFDFYNDSKPETYYVFSYDITALGSQPFRTIRGHMDPGFYTVKCCIDGVDIKQSYQDTYTFSDNSVRKHHVEVYIKLKNDMTDTRRIFIQPNHSAKQTSEQYKIENLKIVEGNKYTNGWTPAPSDIKTEIDNTNSNIANNYYSKTQTDAAIKVATDSITSTVRTEITTVNNKVDNLQVGGTNLIKNTSNQLEHIERSDWHIMISESSTKNFNLADYLGQRLTLRIWIEKPSVDSKLQLYFNSPGWKSGNVVKAGQSGYSQFTVDIPATLPTRWNIAIGGGNGVAFSLDYKELKAEVGDFATSWTLSPEDQQYGGRNLLFHSSVSTDNLKYLKPQGATVDVITDGNIKAYKITAGSESGDKGAYYNSNNGVKNLLAGRTYTYSFWLKSSVDDDFSFGSIGHYQTRGEESELHVSSDRIYRPNKIKANVWTKVSVTFYVKKDCCFIPYLWYLQTNQVLYVYDLKLEEGNIPTDWSPAPEDMATAEQAQQAQNDANDANSKADSNEHRVSLAESTIKQLSDSISMMVTDSNGSSMMTQTSDGWTFNIGSITSAIDSATNNIDNLSGSLSQTNNVVNNLNNLANDLSKKTAYINMTTDETGAPCIELGKTGNAFKVRITNTSVDFIQGSSKIAYVSNQALFIEKAIIKSELQIGETKGFVWKTRSNGNMGLRWFGSV